MMLKISIKDVIKQKTFGGIATLLCGDFRQCLLVVVRGTRANIIDAYIKSSVLWGKVSTYHLTKDMRVYLHND